MDSIKELVEADHTSAYAVLLELEKKSAESDELYGYFEAFMKLLSHKNSLVRVRGFRLCCAQAKWDTEGKLENHIGELLEILNDEKPTAVRQGLAALKNVVRYKPNLCGRIDERLAEIDLEKYAESMRSLIKKDIDELRTLL